MAKIKLASSETKTINGVFGVEQYAVVVLAPEYSEDKKFLYYKTRIYSIHENKEDAINFIKYNVSFHGSYIIPITQINREHYNV